MTYKAIQWATGAMGRAVLRTMIDHPDVEVVGVYTYSPQKVGQDIGLLAGRAETGVLATDDLSQILALDADVVVHAGMLKPYTDHTDDFVPLLESHKNVICLNGYSNPAYWDQEHSRRIAQACLDGDASFMGAGMNPGVVVEQLAATASGLCSRVDTIRITECFDAAEIRNPHYLFEMLGFGGSVDNDPNDPAWGPTAALNPMYEETVSVLAARLGMRLDAVTTAHEFLPATTDLTLPAGLVAQGTVSHTRWRWIGHVGGAPMIVLTINWFVEEAHLGGDQGMWTVQIDGQPCVTLRTEVTKNPDDHSRMGAEQYSVGGVVVNALPYVVDAPAGIVMRPLSTPYRHVW
ncbi:hypothetical protein [Rudaeicoccus suwonensis]|uniref:Dihydrodipicolinate reductase N-terminal domain-containing protein n=1 Tax=Rudaeicoccus suwonensis TaxID=657409 RepID=A0A561DX09_9MICO|nr:hypothetical protein [Rudaeicoccus suwonensis]TWE07893.1 hypothetical protein BKA23_3260 [Rudaeicoccus suwonensis]